MNDADDSSRVDEARLALTKTVGELLLPINRLIALNARISTRLEMVSRLLILVTIGLSVLIGSLGVLLFLR